MNVLKKIKLNMLQMDMLLDINNNFDVIKRELCVGDKDICFYYIDGFLKDSNMQDVLKFFLNVKVEEMQNITTAKEFVSSFITYPETTVILSFDAIVTSILSGSVALFVDDIDECVIIDVRQYPQRTIQEPENDKVLRGSKDGFIETPMENIALIRRRIRSKNLKIQYLNMGSVTNNDVVLCYMSDKVDNNILKLIRDKLDKINPETLTMGSQSLVEALVPRKWYNPFPKVKFSERPDVVASNILEGRVILMVDNTPSVIILPTYLVDFFNEAEDFYFSPPTATFLKITRILIFILSLVITPIWLLLVNNINMLPDYMQFLKINEMNSLPLVIQLLLLEFAINIIKTASINTPSIISSSISLIGTIILGDIAITTKIIVPEAMLVTAIAVLGYYSQPSYELGYSIKYMRIVLLILTAIFNIYGLIVGLILFILLLATNKTITQQSYLYPIFPLDLKALKKVFIRDKNKC